MADHHAPLDGALTEHIRLADKLALIVQDFQGRKQEVGAIQPERGVVGPGGNAPVFPHEHIIECIELPLLRLDVLVRVILGLILDEGTHTVPQTNQALDTALCRAGEGNWGHAAVLSEVHFTVHDGIAVIAYCGVGGDGIIRLRVLQFGGSGLRVHPVDVLDGLGQLVLQTGPLDGYYSEILPAVLGALRGLHTQHHLRVVDEVTIDGKAVSSLPQLHPGRFGQVDVFPLLQEDDVRHDLRAGVGLERIVGEPDGPQQLRPLGQIPAHGGVFGIHGVAAGDKGDDSAGAHLVQRLSEEVVVDAESQPVIRLIIDLIASKRNIAHSHIKEVFGIADTFIALDGNAGTLIELLGDAPGEAVQLHTVQLAVPHGLRQHPEEVAHAAGRLQDVAALEAHIGKHVIDGPDDHGGGIVGVESRRPGGGIFLLGQQGLELGILAVALLEAVSQTAPAHILGQNLLLFRRGETALRLQLFQQPDGSDIAGEFFAGGAHAQSVVVDVVVMALFLRDFRVKDGGRDFSGSARCRRSCGCLLPLLRLGLLRSGWGFGLRLDGLLQISQEFSHWSGGLPLSQQMLVQGIFGHLDVKLGARHDVLEQRAVRFAQGHAVIPVGHQHKLS